MGCFFDDFENGFRSELADEMGKIVSANAASAGAMRPDGSFELTQNGVQAVITGSVTDVVMLALRRYHEWTESAPR